MFASLLKNNTARPTAIAQVSPRVDTPLPPPLTPSADAPQLPPRVLEAQQRVKDNPKDPNAQLDLSLAYFDARLPRQSGEVLQLAAELAGPDNEPFFLRAAEEFTKRKGWVPAAGMYLRAVKTHGLNADIPPDLLYHFHEAVYKASEKADLTQYLQFDTISRVDQPIALIAQARNAFYTGRLDDAHVFLNQVKRIHPGMLETALLEAEFDAAEGRKDEARLLLNGLTANLSAPQWIRDLAEEYLKRLV